MKFLLLADTHVPKRARDLPEQVWDEVARADVVVHAGDWVDISLLDRLEDASKRLIAVYGNNDRAEFQDRIPEVAHETVEGVRLSVIHETGPSHTRDLRCEEMFPDSDVLVFGHSHIPWDTITPNGLRLLNPGSPTDRRRQPFCTYMTCEIADGELTHVQVHQLPPRVQ